MFTVWGIFTAQRYLLATRIGSYIPARTTKEVCTQRRSQATPVRPGATSYLRLKATLLVPEVLRVLKGVAPVLPLERRWPKAAVLPLLLEKMRRERST